MKLLACKPTLVLFSAVILAATSVTAQSAVLTVTNTQDSGAGSLRDTIAVASAGDTIQFDAALNGQTITLTSAQILIDKNLTINGPGADKLTVQRSTANGTPAFRIFDISLDNFSGGSVTLTGLTLANGNASQGGGGVSFSGTVLTIANCVVSGNSATYGGGIYGSYGFGQPRVNITNSVISGNRAENGGAIYIDYFAGSYFSGPARLAMTNSTISGNVATSLGGGLYNRGSSVITNSTISANVATMDAAGGGGGIYNEGNLAITNSTISGNSASLGGGIKNVQIHYFYYPGTSNITSSTISGNSASEGGGIYSFSSATLRPRNSIIARNTLCERPGYEGRSYLTRIQPHRQQLRRDHFVRASFRSNRHFCRAHRSAARPFAKQRRADFHPRTALGKSGHRQRGIQRLDGRSTGVRTSEGRSGTRECTGWRRRGHRRT